MATGIDWNDKYGLIDIGIDIATEEHDTDRTGNDIQQPRHGGCATAMLVFLSMTSIIFIRFLNNRVL